MICNCDLGGTSACLYCINNPNAIPAPYRCINMDGTYVDGYRFVKPPLESFTPDVSMGKVSISVEEYRRLILCEEKLKKIEEGKDD